MIVRPPNAFHNPPRLISVGRLMSQKGHAVFISRTCTRESSVDVADGRHRRTRARVTRSRRTFVHASRIHWLGVREDVPQCLADADVFVFPSRWEGFGLALSRLRPLVFHALRQTFLSSMSFISETDAERLLHLEMFLHLRMRLRMS